SDRRQRAAVSVVVPAFNYGHFLPDCLASVLDQEGVDVDVLVIDDASTDNTFDVASDFSDLDPRVRVVRHQHNRGHIETFNEGLVAATAPYVLKLDADDMLAPGALARSTALLDANPNVGFVSGPVRAVSRPPSRASARRVRRWTISPGRDWLARRCDGACNTI